VESVPEHVECGDFVGEEFDAEEHGAYGDDPPVSQCVETDGSTTQSCARGGRVSVRGVNIQSGCEACCDDKSRDRAGSKCHARIVLHTLAVLIS